MRTLKYQASLGKIQLLGLPASAYILPYVRQEYSLAATFSPLDLYLQYMNMKLMKNVAKEVCGNSEQLLHTEVLSCLVLSCVGGSKCCSHSHCVCNKTQAIYCLILQTGLFVGQGGRGGKMYGMRSVFQSLLKTGFPFQSVSGLIYLVSTRSEQLNNKNVPLRRTKRAISIHGEIR